MNNKYFSEHFMDELSDALEDAFSSIDLDIKNNATVNKESVKSSVHRQNTKTVDKKTLPTLPSSVTDIEYNTRYSLFINYAKNLDYTNYPDELTDGFKAAINQYQTLINESNKDFKKVDLKLFDDLRECKKKSEQTNDNYLLGYYDGLSFIKKIFNQHKLASYKKLANKFD